MHYLGGKLYVSVLLANDISIFTELEKIRDYPQVFSKNFIDIIQNAGEQSPGHCLFF